VSDIDFFPGDVYDFGNFNAEQHPYSAAKCQRSKGGRLGLMP